MTVLKPENVHDWVLSSSSNIDSLRTEIIEAQIQIHQIEILLLSDGQSEPILRINDQLMAVGGSLCDFDFDGQAESTSLLFDD